MGQDSSSLTTFLFDLVSYPLPPSRQSSLRAWVGQGRTDHKPEAARYGEADNKHMPPPAGPGYRPVVTLNGWTLSYRVKDGVKEFQLGGEPVERELAPGMVARLWGYNGQSPGPTLECVEGGHVRIFVTNRLPEHTKVHWHGLIPVGSVRHRVIRPSRLRRPMPVRVRRRKSFRCGSRVCISIEGNVQECSTWNIPDSRSGFSP